MCPMNFFCLKVITDNSKLSLTLFDSYLICIAHIRIFPDF